MKGVSIIYKYRADDTMVVDVVLELNPFDTALVNHPSDVKQRFESSSAL